MRYLTRLAGGIGAGAAMLIGGAAAGASAATPPTKAAAPAHPSQLNLHLHDYPSDGCLQSTPASPAATQRQQAHRPGRYVRRHLQVFHQSFHRVRLAGGGTG